MAKEHGVILTGFIKGKKLHSLLTHTRCFVLPSSHEGLPIALLEAMSYNLPVIVSDIPAYKEVELKESFYFKVGNINELSQKLQKVTTENYHNIQYDMSKYNWDKIAIQVADIYKKVIEK